MEELFLATFTLRRTEYMRQPEQVFGMRLIRAKDEEEARRKLNEYWEKQSDPYAVWYTVEAASIDGVIA